MVKFTVVALNVADVAAAATVTDAGTVRVGLVFVSVTVLPPAAPPGSASPCNCSSTRSESRRIARQRRHLHWRQRNRYALELPNVAVTVAD